MLVFAAVFCTIVIGNHYYFRTTAYDYAVYNFAFWDYSHFHISSVSLYKVCNADKTFLQDHFSLTLMYFVPVYWLIGWLTGTYTLLLILVAFILWSAWAIYKLLLLKTGDGWLGVFAVLYYFLLQGRYSAFSSDANILTIVSCFVPLFLYYFEAKKYVFAFIIFVLSLFSREDMPLWFVFVFIVLAIWHWRERKIIAYCIVGIFVSVLYFILLFKVFIPITETPQNRYVLFQYAALGKTPGAALLHILSHPIETFKLLYINQSGDPTFNGVKGEFYWVYLISGGFILFFRPRYFIWFIPLVFQKMFNDDFIRWGIYGYYAIAVVTMLPVSVFLILAQLKIRWIKYSISVVICSLTFFVTRYKMDVGHRAVPWGTTTKENIFDARFFNPPYNTAEIYNRLKLIPEDAKVCASASLLPHLSQRKYSYEFPDVEDADYIAVFTFQDYYASTQHDYTRILNKYITNSSWKIIANVPPFILLKKN